MKTFNKFYLISAAALALCGCQKAEEPAPTPVGPQPETRTLTFILPDGDDASVGQKIAWQAGDAIVVHGEYAKDQVIVTLDAADIAADGRSATKTVDNLFPYKREDCGSTLYASYPASASDNLKHCFFYSKFSDTNTQLLAACNDGDSFKFNDVCGVISFNAGEFDSYTLTGKKKEALGYSYLQVKVTDAEQNYLQYKGEPVITLEGEIKDGQAAIFVPGGISAEGLVIKFKKDGSYCGIYRSSEPFAIERGKVCDLGDIASEIAAYDDPFSADIKNLDENGNANCYILTEPGKFKFKAVKGNASTNFLENVADASILWETYNNATEPEAGSIISSVTYAEDYMIIHTPDALVPGNAVIAAKDDEGKVLWSWHIWVPATPITTSSFGGAFSGETMDRNLGALVVAQAGAEYVAPEAFGMVYQWGRKDPFTAAREVKSSSLAKTTGVQFEVAPGQITLEESIANPTLLGHKNNEDWLTPSDNGMWSDNAKTIYDPCPAGYRVPSSSNSFFGDISKKEGWAFDKTNAWMTIGNPTTVLPLGGYMDDYSVGSMAHAYDRGLYWSSAPSTSAEKTGCGRGEDVRPGSSISFKDTPKARAGHVRCVAE